MIRAIPPVNADIRADKKADPDMRDKKEDVQEHEEEEENFSVGNTPFYKNNPAEVIDMILRYEEKQHSIKFSKIFEKKAIEQYNKAITKYVESPEDKKQSEKNRNWKKNYNAFNSSGIYMNIRKQIEVIQKKNRTPEQVAEEKAEVERDKKRRADRKEEAKKQSEKFQADRKEKREAKEKEEKERLENLTPEEKEKRENRKKRGKLTDAEKKKRDDIHYFMYGTDKRLTPEQKDFHILYDEYGRFDFFDFVEDDDEEEKRVSEELQNYANDNKELVLKAYEKVSRYAPEHLDNDEKTFTNYWRKNKNNFNTKSIHSENRMYGHGWIVKHIYSLQNIEQLRGDDDYLEEQWKKFQRFFELYREKEKRGERKEKRDEKRDYTISTWQEYVKKYRDENQGMTYKRAMIEASESWNKMKSNSDKKEDKQERDFKEDKQERDFKEDKQERDFKEDNRAEERRRANREAMKKADEEAKAIAGTEAKAIAPGNCVFTCPVCNTSYNIIHSMIDKKNIPIKKIAEAKKQQPEKAPPQKTKIEPDRKTRAFPKESKILTKGDLYNIRGPNAPEPLTWIQHVKRYREANPGISYKQALKDAKTSYERVKVIKTRNKGLIRALDL